MNHPSLDSQKSLHLLSGCLHPESGFLSVGPPVGAPNGHFWASETLQLFGCCFWASTQWCSGLIPGFVLKGSLLQCLGNHLGCRVSNSVSAVLKARVLTVCTSSGPRQLFLTQWLEIRMFFFFSGLSGIQSRL